MTSASPQAPLLAPAEAESGRAANQPPARVQYPLESSAGHLLRRALQRHQSLFQECAVGLALTAPQFAALSKLAELGNTTQNRLGRLVAMDPATVQGVARRLVLRGLVRTDKDPMDKRTLVLAITEEGERVVNEARRAGAGANATLLSGLTPEEQQAFLGLLRKITAAPDE
jgi:DNA-binding MarR family transcriptional regulator